MNSNDAERPLQGLRVIDLTRALAGPYATLLLAGLGAEVIKVEDPQGGDLARDNSPYVGRQGVVVERQHDDDLSISHLSRSRGKLGISLDLKRAGAAAVFADLCRDADIVVENFTAGTADRLGVGYAAARSANPRIIYCSISGFGATPGQAGGKAMDIIIQALSGVMYASGGDGDPPVRMGIPIADLLAPVFAVIGILSALEQRHRSGQGQQVDVSMLGALTSFVAIENWAAMAAAGMPARTGLTVQRLSPFGVFECSDGYVALVAVHEPLARGLFRAMGRPELSDDPRYATRDARVAHAPELETLLGDWFRLQTVKHAVALLDAEGVPAAPVRHPHEALVDPRVMARCEVQAVHHPHYPSEVDLHTAGVPIVFSQATTGFDPHLPVYIGQHNRNVYADRLGYSDGQIEELERRGVI